MISKNTQIAGLMGGVVGALAWKQHRILGWLVGSTLASGAYYLWRGKDEVSPSGNTGWTVSS
jgi:hypothetical protein